MMKKMKVELIDQAAEAVQHLGEMTGRSAVRVLWDALKTYEWLLRRQHNGYHIVVMNSEGKPETRLTPLISNHKAANQIFGEPQESATESRREATTATAPTQRSAAAGNP
jgi:hypothetical protein